MGTWNRARVGAIAWTILTVILLASCDEGPVVDTTIGGPEAGVARGIPAGTYLLDLRDWRERANENTARARYSDLWNQSHGADPFSRPNGEFGSREERPAPPQEWAEFDESEREALQARARAWLGAVGPTLEERLVLGEDGTFVFTHTSNALEGGSVQFGIHGSLSTRGTWARGGDALALTVTEVSRPPGPTRKVEVRIAGRVLSDGRIELEATRDGWRNQVSVYRRE